MASRFLGLQQQAFTNVEPRLQSDIHWNQHQRQPLSKRTEESRQGQQRNQVKVEQKIPQARLHRFTTYWTHVRRFLGKRVPNQLFHSQHFWGCEVQDSAKEMGTLMAWWGPSDLHIWSYTWRFESSFMMMVLLPLGPRTKPGEGALLSRVRGACRAALAQRGCYRGGRSLLEPNPKP